MPKFLVDKKSRNILKIGVIILALASLLTSIVTDFQIKDVKAATSNNNYEYSLRFGLDWQTDQFDGIYGTAIDPATGDIYLSVNRSGGSSYYIQRYDSAGTYISKFSTYYMPRGPLTISGGYIYDPEGSTVNKYSLAGSYIGNAAASLSMAASVTIDGSGNLYVADKNAHLVKKFDSSGTLLLTLGSTEGSGDGQFDYPMGAAVDSSGNIYVADSWNNRVQKFDSAGTYVTQWSMQLNGNSLGWPYGIYIDGSDNIYVNNYSVGNVEKYNTTGTLLTTLSIGSGTITMDAGGNIYTSNKKYNAAGDTVLLTLNTYERTLDGQFYSAENLTTDSSGNIYVADTGNNRIQKFDSSGTFLLKFGSSGSGDGQFSSPRDVVVDSSGYIYVLDKDNKRVQKFDSTGVYVTQWALELDVPNAWGEGESITIDSSNNIYVYNRFVYAVEKFTSTGTKLMNIGSEGTGDGQFSGYGNKISIDQSSNTLYVMSAGRIQAFDSSGTYLRQWSLSSMSNPKSITANNGYVYVGGGVWYSGNAGFYIYDSTGNYINRYWPSSGASAGQFNFVNDIIIDSSSNVYILGAGNSASDNYVQKFLLLPPPADPTSCTTSEVTGTSMTVGWTDNSSDESNFTIEKSINGTDYSVVSSTIPANIVAKGVGDLNYNTQYWFRVKATNANGDSSYTTCVPATTTDTTVIEPYRFDTKWGSLGSGNEQFNYPTGAITDASGYVYIVDSVNNSIKKFDSNGTYITSWGSDILYGPHGIAIDSASAYLYVANTSSHNIVKYNTSGTYITSWGSSGSGDGQFNSPYSITVDASDNVYVADTNNHRIQKFTSAGTYTAQWGSLGSGNGQFNYPADLAHDSSGNIYVVEESNNRIQKFDSAGTYTAQWGSSGSGNGQFSLPSGIAIDTNDYIYIGDTSNRRIQKFTSAGTYVTQWGSFGTGNGQFNDMYDVAVDSSGNIYVPDYNHHVQKFAPNTNVAPTISGFAATSEQNTTLSWTFNDRNSSDTESAYQIQVSTSSGFASTVCDTGKTSGSITSIAYNDTSCTTPLDAGGAYYARVKVWDSSDVASDFTSAYSFTAISPAPTAPSTCVTSSITSSGMTIGWTDNSNNETYFDLEKSTDGITYETVNNLIAANAISYDVSSLSSNVEYWFRVRAKGTAGNSSYATCSSAYTLADTGFSLTHGSSLSTSLWVSINSPGANPSNTEYAIMIGSGYLQSDESIGVAEQWQTRSAWGTATASGLTPNATYEIKAKARNGNNVETNFGTTENRTTLAATPLLTISEIQPTSLKITLGENGNPTGTQYKVVNGAEFLQANGTFGGTAVWQSYTEWGGAIGITATSLTENTSYSIQVIAKNSESAEAGSSISTAYTAAGAPSNFQATSINSTNLVFSVDRFENDTVGSSAYFFYGYSVPEGEGGYYGYSYWVGGATGGYQWTHDSLTANKQFTHHVKYRNQNEVETSVVDLTTCTAANAPSASTSNVTTTALDLTINKNGNPNGTYYQVTTGSSYLSEAGTFSGTLRWFTADSTSTFAISGLTPGESYAINVKAKNCDSIETDSYPTTTYTLANTPRDPTITPYQTSVNVKPNIDYSYNGTDVLYAIQFATNALFTDAQYVQTSGALGATAVWQTINDWGGINGKLVTGLSTNTTYYIKITAKNGGGGETSPTTASTTTSVNTPGALTIVSSSETTTSFRFNLDTNSNSSNVQYAIQSPTTSKYLSDTGMLASDTAVWKTSTEWDAIDGNSSNGTTVTEISIGNSCYVLKAKAKGTSGTETDFGALSDSMCNLANTPSAPTLASKDSSSEVALTINDTSNSSSTTYAIYESTKTQYVQSNYRLGTNAYFKTKTTWESEDSNTEYPIVISGLSESTPYTFKVIAKNSAGTETALSSASNTITTNSGGGGGCTSNWTYSNWGTCTNGIKTRTKSDSNGCPGASTITEEQACSCAPAWTCQSWSACANNSQSRTCTDSNNCGITTEKPTETQACTITCTPNWTYGNWSACTNGTKNRIKTDSNKCYTPSETTETTSCSNTCTPEWHYSDWSACTNGNQSRTKTDTNNCGTTNTLTESQTCNSITACQEDWACTTWSNCSAQGGQTRSCTDRNSCGTTSVKPLEIQSCTPACNEVWICTNWSACTNDLKTRVCTDQNACSTTISKPSEAANCSNTGTLGDGGGNGDGNGDNNGGNDNNGGDNGNSDETKTVEIPSDALTRGEFLAYVVNDLDLQNTHKDYLETCGKNKDECLGMLNLGTSTIINKSETNSKELDIASQLGLTSVFTEKNNKELQTNAVVTRAEAIKVILIALNVIKPETCEELIIAAGSEEALIAQKTPFKDLINNVTKCWVPKVANSACSIKLINCGKNAEFKSDSFLLRGDFNEMMKKAKEYAKQKNIKFNITQDTDKDGLTDLVETEIYGTDPKNPDTDGDSLKDGEEINKYATNPLNADTDNDTLKDNEEVKKYKTNPLKQDTDGDNFSDNIEIAANTDPLDPLDYPKDTKGVGVSDDWQTKNNIVVENGEQDTDNDGLSDKMEYQYRTDPKNPDTDGDSFSDGQEVLDMHTDPLKFTTIDKVPLAISNIAQDQIIGSSSFYIKGTAKPNTFVQIYVRNSFGREKVIANATADSTNTFDTQTDSIKDGKYLLLAKAFDTKKSEVISSAPIRIEINSAINIEPPTLISFGGVTLTEDMMKSGFKITTPEIPTIRGKTEFGNEIITSWKSLLSSSALVADSPTGEFSVKPAKPLEEGEHTVTVYATRKKDNVMSKALKLSFIVKNGLSSIDLSNVNKLAGNIAGFYKKDTIAKVFYQTMIGIGAAGIIWLLYFLFNKYRDYKAYAAKMRKRKEKEEKGEEDNDE